MRTIFNKNQQRFTRFELQIKYCVILLFWFTTWKDKNLLANLFFVLTRHFHVNCRAANEMQLYCVDKKIIVVE